MYKRWMKQHLKKYYEIQKKSELRRSGLCARPGTSASGALRAEGGEGTRTREQDAAADGRGLGEGCGPRQRASEGARGRGRAARHQ